MPDEPGSPQSKKTDKSLSLVQREVALIVVLCVVAIVVFLGTRRLAEWHRATATASALAWYERGQTELAAGNTDAGIASIRKAVSADRGSVEFSLGLVRALRGANEDEEAWQILLGLRQQEPEDSEINYRLGRLAARRGDPDLAVRYLNHALYGIEPDNAPIDRAEILTELATVLLDEGDVESAEGVLALLARDLPDDSEARLGLARLYQRADDHAAALEQYAETLATDPTKPEALLGASDAAFAVGNLVLARTYLERSADAGLGSPELAARRELVERAVTADPLSERLGMTERVRRLTEGLTWAGGRFDGCVPAPAAGSRSALLDEELEAFRRQPRQDLRDTDVLAAGVSLIARVEADVRARCGLEDPVGDAWSLIERARAGRS